MKTKFDGTEDGKYFEWRPAVIKCIQKANIALNRKYLMITSNLDIAHGTLGQAGLISFTVKFSNPITSETALGNVLQDTVSDSTMVTKSLAKELKWTGKQFQLTLRGIGDTKRLIQSEKVSLSINSLTE
jgi:hypothetical protein